MSGERISGTYPRDRANDPAALFAGQPGDAGVKQITVEFERGPTAASAARNALLALEHRLAPALLDDLRLLVSELVTNSIRHSDAAQGATVGLHVQIEGHTIRVEVTDPGHGFDPQPRTETQSKASGWGLYLVDRLADRWGVARSNLTRVWFEIDGATRFQPQRAV